MKGTKEFNQKIFELFMLYNQRVMLYKERFAPGLGFKEEPLEVERANLVHSMRKRAWTRRHREMPGLSLSSLNQAIRDKERVFFRCFSPNGIYQEHPFVKLCSELKLNRVEQKMLICLLAEYLKDTLFDKFIPFPHEIENNPLILVFPKPELAFAKTNLLGEDNKLVRFGLTEKYSVLWIMLREPLKLRLKNEVKQYLLGFSEKEFKPEKPSQVEKEGLLEFQAVEFGLNQVVLSEKERRQIEQAIYFYQCSGSEKWFSKLFAYQSLSAILALFYGPPGTGKTYTAMAIAGEMKKPLARVQYANLKNMFYGNSEKFLVSCFELAKQKDAVLLFDEADALITSREKINTSSVAELEHALKNIFLEEIERFNGIVILTSNLAESLDFALERRLNLKLEFSLPGVEERAKLWKKFLKKTPLSEEVDVVELSEKFPLAGGHIKNAVLSAIRELAYLRRQEPEARLSQSMLKESAQRESQFLEFKNTTKIAGFGR